MLNYFFSKWISKNLYLLLRKLNLCLRKYITFSDAHLLSIYVCSFDALTYPAAQEKYIFLRFYKHCNVL